MNGWPLEYPSSSRRTVDLRIVKQVHWCDCAWPVEGSWTYSCCFFPLECSLDLVLFDIACLQWQKPAICLQYLRRVRKPVDWIDLKGWVEWSVERWVHWSIDRAFDRTWMGLSTRPSIGQSVVRERERACGPRLVLSIDQFRYRMIERVMKRAYPPAYPSMVRSSKRAIVWSVERSLDRAIDRSTGRAFNSLSIDKIAIVSCWSSLPEHMCACVNACLYANEHTQIHFQVSLQLQLFESVWHNSIGGIQHWRETPWRML